MWYATVHDVLLERNDAVLYVCYMFLIFPAQRRKMCGRARLRLEVASRGCVV